MSADLAPLLAPLIAPIEGERPTGDSLRFDPLFDEVRELRREEDATLPQGIWKRELKRADWAGVAAACERALITRTKDLQFAAWLTEAWLHLDGVRGLDRGLRLIAALCRDYWDDLYPAIDREEGVGARVAPIAWVADRLLISFKQIPVTAPQGEDAQAYAWSDWEAGVFPKAAVTHEKFLVSASLTPTAAFVELESDLASLADGIGEIDAVLAEWCDEESAPSFAPLRDLVAAIHAFVARVLSEREGTGEPMPAVNDPRDPHVEISIRGGDAENRPAIYGAIASRAEAYQRLREAADYLQRTEPHSPVPSIVRRGIAWGEMSAADLYAELFKKSWDIFSLLGIQPTETRR
jgi:type VI secretion system protein ImpA